MSAGRALAALVADPSGTGGVVLRGGPGPARDGWVAAFRATLPPGTPLLRLPPGITPDRLVGGLDLGATLASGRPVVRRGLLADADGGVVLVPMAERLPLSVTSALVEALDTGRIRLEREGSSEVHRARIVLLLLDESEPDEEGIPAALLDRVGPVVTLHPRWRPGGENPPASPGPALRGSEATLAVVQAAAGLGIESLRPALRTLGVARALAGADGLAGVDEARLAEAAAMVLGPRALRVPAPPDEAPEGTPPDAPPTPAEAPEEQGPEGTVESQRRPLADRVMEAVRPALPPGLLLQLGVAGATRQAAARTGRAGEERRQLRHGRTAGSRPGDPRRGGRLDLTGTLRAAAPWQRLRAVAAERSPGVAPGAHRSDPGHRPLHVRADDLRIRVLSRKASTTAIFLVDASGSQALNRLAEAKGAVELLLAESYVRRDSVALVAFRGSGAQVILPPTRALARARRALAGLPGGGGTPLASGLEAGFLLAEQVRREGSSPLLVLLTDARANVARDGRGGRDRAEEESRGVARLVAFQGIPSLLVDSSPRGSPFARELAGLMQGRYLRLPGNDPHLLAAVLRGAQGEA